MTAKQGLLPLNQSAQFVIGDLAYHDYEGVAFDHAASPAEGCRLTRGATESSFWGELHRCDER